MYQVFADPISPVVHASLSGFFDTDEVQAFAREEQDAARIAITRHGFFDLLIETPGGFPQGQAALDSFKRLITSAPIKARRIVIVAASALLRLQIKRVLVSERLQVFETTAEAEAWLRAESLADVA